MRSTTIRQTYFVFMLACGLPIAACDENTTPTAPTQTAQAVSAAAPSPAPTPTPSPTPQPPPSTGPIVSLSGFVAILARGGPKDLDISFRIDDSTIVRAAAGTPVTWGGQTFDTDAIRPGQQVAAEGRRNGGFLDATKITILAQAQ